eukprot:TRINITY_DN40854_c0_g1_i1.p1 TRINITY_DN40854_c0_g1~~TRINITY_DN40854_c0_g1_i1.p1  ORF type:complete len:324 (+),score=65.04 TRINITY_DN40854_c0_g1_i1:193-1164(+)
MKRRRPNNGGCSAAAGRVAAAKDTTATECPGDGVRGDCSGSEGIDNDRVAKVRRTLGGLAESSGCSVVARSSQSEQLRKSATTKRQRRAAKAALAAAKKAIEAGMSEEAASAAASAARIAVGGVVGTLAHSLDNDEGVAAESPPRLRKSEAHVGPPVGIKTMSNDEWQTCRSAWEALVPIIGEKYRDKRIWQPFYYDGECSKHLASLGFKRVTHTPEDFFKRVKSKKFLKSVDLIWDNPPYTNQDIKEKVLRACEASGKPFCLLLPLSILHSQFMRDVLETSKIQTVIPRKVHVKKRNQAQLPFKYLVWLCYKMDLKKDLFFI